MKNLFGIIFFIAMVILNIILENQKNARLEREANESDDQKIPPSGHGGFPKKAPYPARPLERPVQTNSTTDPDTVSLQDLMQEFFQREAEASSKTDYTPEENPASPPAAELTAKPTALPVAMPLAAETPVAPTIPIEPPVDPQPLLPASSPIRKRQAIAITRARQGLRQAVIMAEVLGKPKALR
jgi:hypothetical protein